MDDQRVSIPLLLSSRCRLTLKGRLHMDPARTTGALPEPERRARLNATARFVIERCDGLHSVGDVARDLAVAWRVPEARATRDVVAFLEMLRLQGYVHVDDSNQAST